MPESASVHRPSVFEWAVVVLAGANIVYTTLCLGGYRPETLVITSGLTGATVVVHLLALAWEKTNRLRVHPASWWLVPFAVYAAANVQWVTPVRWLGWFDYLGWTQMMVMFWVVLNGVRSAKPRQALFMLLVVLGITAVAIAGYQRFVRPEWLMLGRVQSEYFIGRASGPFGSPNALAALLLLLVPACGALAFRAGASATGRVWWGWVTLVLGFGLVLTISRGAWLSLAVALALWPLVRPGWGWRRRALSTTGVVLGMAVIGAGVFAVSPKVRARVTALVRDMGELSRPIMWRASWNLFREQPAFGTGAGSYNVLFEKHRPERFPDDPQWAHNEYLNTLSDYGAVGFILFFGSAAVIALRRGGRLRTEEQRTRRVSDMLDGGVVHSALGIGLLAFALQLSVDFHLKIPALVLVFGCCAGLWVGGGRPFVAGAPHRTRRASWFLTGLGVACVAGMIWVVVPWYRAEGIRYRARQSIDQLAISHASGASVATRVIPIRLALEQAVRLAPGNAQAWADLSYALALSTAGQESASADLNKAAETAADHALSLSTVPAEFWIRRGVARDLQGRWIEAGDDFVHALTLAPANALVWFYHADHLCRNRVTVPMGKAALAFCLRLDPGNPEGLALRQRLAISPKAP